MLKTMKKPNVPRAERSAVAKDLGAWRYNIGGGDITVSAYLPSLVK